MAKKPIRGPKRSSSGTASFRDTKIIWFIIAIIALIVAGGVFYILNSLTKQDTYYVLNTNIPSRTQITAADLSPVTTSQGSAPQNAIGLDVIQQGTTYTKYPLLAGDVVSSSNAGSLDTINEGIPDNWVVTSFNPGDADPVVENLQRGDYFDVLVTNMKKSDQRSIQDDNGIMDNVQVGQYIFRNLMILDNPMSTTANANNDSANGATSQTQNSTTMFLVGASPKNAAMITMVMGQYDTKIVMSPRQNSYADPTTLDALYKTFNFKDEIGKHPNGIIMSNCVDSSTGDEISEDCTDNTFAPQERDEFGVPFNASDSERDKQTGDPMPLTEFELQWCEQLFSNSYYSGRTSNKWSDEKQYCADHTRDGAKGDQDFKTLLEKQKEDLDKQRAENSKSRLGTGSTDSNADSSTSSSDEGSLDESNSNDTTASDNTNDNASSSSSSSNTAQ